MKKTISIFFLLIYGLTAVSATVHLHYCMNKFIGAGFSHAKSRVCEKCGMEKGEANSCCKDEHKQLQLNREHQQAVEGFVVPDIAVPEAGSSFLSYTNFSYPRTADTVACSYVPPDLPGDAHYILYCIFRI